MPYAVQSGKPRAGRGSYAVALQYERIFSAQRNDWVINADAPEYLSA
jgi:hypothetical protein